MTSWYDPMQLLRTAPRVAASAVFGARADPRIIEALATVGDDNDDHLIDMYASAHGQECWIDYVSDAGDGWNPTYAVAHVQAQTTLCVAAPNGSAWQTKRGRILVFGGDEVYPFPDRNAYQEKLENAYRVALSGAIDPPDAYAIPGNHDWYDSLVAFTREFCMGRWFGPCRTTQRRSYFARRLPHGWWLLGVDIQLGSDIDAPQVEYFRRIAHRMTPDDRVILCTAEPSWVYETIYSKDAGSSARNLKFLEDEVLGGRILVYLAGDLHHYRRHEHPSGIQRITAGGGGAFLHPTCGPDACKLLDGSIAKKCYPSQRTSTWLATRNLAFIFWNRSFGLFPALVYMLLVWTLLGVRSDEVRFSGLRDVFERLFFYASATGWVAAMVLVFWLFTDTHSRGHRFLAGSVHALVHATAACLLGWGSDALAWAVLPSTWGPIPHRLVTLLFIAVSGWVVGSLIMGLYLLISLVVFKRHTNEAFSSLRIQDYKCFLRMRIAMDRTLTIYPIAIERVPRDWEPGQCNGQPTLVPPADQPIEPRLIEDEPIVITPRADACAAEITGGSNDVCEPQARWFSGRVQ